MAKRFIDTGLFDDNWFLNLSSDGKLCWIYILTRCNHAGIIELYEPIFRVQTGIKDFTGVLKELSIKIILLENGKIFIPSFITYQYPNFPNSKVMQQISAIKILVANKLWDSELNYWTTVGKQLNSSDITEAINISLEQEPLIEPEIPIELLIQMPVKNENNFYNEYHSMKIAASMPVKRCVYDLMQLWGKCWKNKHSIAYSIVENDYENMHKLFNHYREVAPDSDEKKIKEDLQLFFEKSLNINDTWLQERMCLSLMVKKFNEIIKILKNGKTKKETVDIGKFNSFLDRLGEVYKPTK